MGRRRRRDDVNELTARDRLLPIGRNPSFLILNIVSNTDIN